MNSGPDRIHNPKAFWALVASCHPSLSTIQSSCAPFPVIPGGGASQALTALRAGRWFDFYGRSADFGVMVDRWCDALQADMSFRQQLDPSGRRVHQRRCPKLLPAALVMLDYTRRLAGVREEGNSLEWNARPGLPAAESALFRMRTVAGRMAEMKYDHRGVELCSRRRCSVVSTPARRG